MYGQDHYHREILVQFLQSILEGCKPLFPQEVYSFTQLLPGVIKPIMAAIYLSGSIPLRHIKISCILHNPFIFISFLNNLLYPPQYNYLITKSSHYFVIWAISRETQCIFFHLLFVNINSWKCGLSFKDTMLFSSIPAEVL